MRFPFTIAALVLSLCSQVAAKAAFAHFMMGNTADFTSTDWRKEMLDAMAAGIDGFALNMAYNEDTTKNQMDSAFGAASTLGFKLIFSLDYAGNGPWPKADVISLISKWGPNSAYFKHGGSQPLVSTFEGPDQSEDWKDIKSATGCFFMPSWSSLGAMRALQKNTADGLFNWAAWPTGRLEMDTYTDASYIMFLSQKFGGDTAARGRYMMPVSPWFYTNLPQYNKNWIWPSSDLWYTRWQQVLDVDPEYVQIISWNDYGESHYIGGVRQSPPFEHPGNLYDYIENMTHDGWRKTLPAWINLWKKGTTTVAKEEVVMWYLLHEAGGCNDADTTLNTATHIQLESPANGISGAGNIFFDAVLTGPADVAIKFNGRTEKGYFTHGPQSGAGVYHGRQYIERSGGYQGPVTIELSRNGRVFLSLVGMPIGGCGPNGYRNYNPWVGSSSSPDSISAVTSSPNMANQVCTSGWGVGPIDGLCRMTCGMGYCPLGACVCTERGTLSKLPEDKFPKGYSKGDPNVQGLCSFVYTKGFFFPDMCSTTPMPIVEPEVSPFLATVCREGRAKDSGDLATRDLCEHTCKYGHCPIKVCVCTKTGTLKEIQSEHTIRAGVRGFANMDVINRHSGHIAINNMCAFACPYGFCPESACRIYAPNDGSEGSVTNPYVPAVDTALPPGFCPPKEYASFEAISKDLDNIAEHCGPQYILDVVERLFAKINKRYNEIMKDDYPKYFDYYATHLYKQTWTVLKAFMLRQSDRYFECQIMEEIFCCPGCEFKGYDCRYCERGADVCSSAGPWVNGDLPSKFIKKTQPCPPQYQERGHGDDARQSIYWKLRDDKRADFFADLENATGVNSTFVSFPDKTVVESIPPSCVPRPPAEMSEKCLAQNHWFKAPSLAGFSKDEVIDPSVLLGQALENVESVRVRIRARQWEMMTGTYTDVAEETDLVDAVMLPALMLDMMLKQLEEVAKIGKELVEDEIKTLVTNLLGIFFTLLSMGGSLVTNTFFSVARAQISRAMVLVGEGGNLGLGIEGVVSDPDSLAWFIIGLFMSVEGVVNADIVVQAAKARRQFGDNFKPGEVELNFPELKFSDAILMRGPFAKCARRW